MGPCALVVLASFKTGAEFLNSPFALPRTLNFDNYVVAWNEAEVVLTMRNSVIVTVASVLLSTILAVLAAYALGRYAFRFANGLQIFFLIGVIAPVQLIMLPFFVLMRDLGLLGSIASTVIAYTAFNLPLGVLILTPFFATLPRELEEAGTLDGANAVKRLVYIMLPVAKPAITTVLILNGIWIWNDFSVSLILSTVPQIRTLPVGIMSFYGSYSTQWGPIFAAVTLASLPVVIGFLLLSRQFIAGLTAGAVKG
jgi:raffinose/stachyose/melibiose transport system permease protein